MKRDLIAWHRALAQVPLHAFTWVDSRYGAVWEATIEVDGALFDVRYDREGAWIRRASWLGWTYATGAHTTTDNAIAAVVEAIRRWVL